MPPTRLTTEEWLSRKREPYRLRCIGCETTQWVRKTVSPRTKKINQHSPPVYVKEKVDEPWDGQYRCENCHETHDGVLDMKTGEHICMEDDHISQDIDEYKSAIQKAHRFQRIREES